MQNSVFRVFLLASLFCSRGISASDQYETLTTLKASDHLPVAILENEHFIIQEEVTNDGYLNTYNISSDFGEFSAYSRNMLEVRLKEIDALVQLQNLSKTEIFATAAIEAGLSPLTAIIDFSTRPIQTIMGIPEGVGRTFQRYVRKTERNLNKVGSLFTRSEKSSEKQSGSKSKADRMKSRFVSYTEDFFSVGSAERRWHQKFGTNPYTSNTALHEAIHSVSWTDSLGRFGLKHVSMPTIAGVNVLEDMSDLVWSLDAYELRKHNRELLLSEDLDATLVDLLLTTPGLRPEFQTTIIEVFVKLEGVTNREEVLAFALTVEDETQAMMLAQSALYLAALHEKSPLAHFVPLAPFPTAETTNGVCLSAPAFDYVVWTEQTAAICSYLDSKMPDDCSKKLILAGSASAQTLSTLSEWGWQVDGASGI